jgi:polysaccharide export outer membrane protein
MEEPRLRRSPILLSTGDWFFVEKKLMNKTNLFLIICAFAFILFSCASTSSVQKEALSTEQITREIESSKRVKAMNEKLLMSNFSSGRSSHRDYKIGPQDLLEISVFEAEKLNKTVRVSSQGNISLPLIGILKVKGLTTEELEKEIRSLLAEKYLQDPQVNVLIKEYRNQRISVMGAVKSPGVFDVTGTKTILDMLGVAGGLREDAGQLLFLLRLPPSEEEPGKKGKGIDGKKAETFIIDLDGLLVEGNLNLNLSLIHGDVINVPMSGKVFVWGEVKSAGGFAKGKRMTLSQAVIMAGGLNFRANGSETRIIRYTEKGTNKEILTFNIYAIQKGKAEDPYLREYDIVFVPKSGVKTFLAGIKDTFSGAFGIGGVSVGF